MSYPAKGGSLAAEVSSEAGGKGSSKRMVSLRQGDVEAGDVNPSSVAAAFTQVGISSEKSYRLYEFAPSRQPLLPLRA